MKRIFFTYYLLFNIVIATFFGVYLYTSYTQEKSIAIARTSLTSLLVSEWIKGAFSSSDYILKDIVDTVPVSALKYPTNNPIEHERISKYIDKKRKTLPNSIGVGLNDDKCIMTHTPSIIGFDASNREWCSVPMNNPEIETYVSNMFISNTNKMMVIQTRKFPNNKGLAGIGVSLDFFYDLLKKANLGLHGVIAIADNNLKLLARQPAIPQALGKNVNDSIVKAFISSNNKEKSFSQMSPLDNKERLYSIRKVEDLPFVVVVGEANIDWMDGWYKQLKTYILITIVLWLMGGLILRDYLKIMKQKKELEKISTTDYLTGLYNRYKLNEVLKNELNRAKRIKYPFGVIILDIDFFKNINDTYGHNVGDSVLKEISILLKQNIRVTDTLGRWGGEEFLIIVPTGDEYKEQILAEKLRANIEKHSFTTVKNITASFGITTYIEGDNIDSLIKRADDALYKAKENGRNKVEV